MKKATAKCKRHKPSKYVSKLARSFARSNDNVYGGKRNQGLKR